MQSHLDFIFMPLVMIVLVVSAISVLDAHWIWGTMNIAFISVVCAVHIVPASSHALDAA